MLGHLMPILITALTHENLQSLTLADSLIPQVVQLVILTSQVRVGAEFLGMGTGGCLDCMWSM